MALKWLGLVSYYSGPLLFTQLIKYVAPFIMAFIIALSMEGMVGFPKAVKAIEKLRWPYLLVFLVVVGGLIFMFYKIMVELWSGNGASGSVATF